MSSRGNSLTLQDCTPRNGALKARRFNDTKRQWPARAARNRSISFHRFYREFQPNGTRGTGQRKTAKENGVAGAERNYRLARHANTLYATMDQGSSRPGCPGEEGRNAMINPKESGKLAEKTVVLPREEQTYGDPGRASRTEELIPAIGTALCRSTTLLATAESCTGGMIAHEITNIPGSSRWFAGSVVAYSNGIKQNVLGVPEAVLGTHGAVSREAVLAMVQGVRHLLGVRAALAVSGIAGPDGGTPEKPVGTVWIAWALGDAVNTELHRFSGTRLEIKQYTVQTALAGMLDLLRHGT